jgi:NADPH2:quinone reductase
VLLDYRDASWIDGVKEATGGKGADVIYDSVGGSITDQSLKCIAWCGRLLIIGFASGPIPEIKANRILLKNISVLGLHWGAYALHDPKRIPETFNALFRLYEEGKIRPVIHSRHPLERLPAALEALAGRQTYGKVIVIP